MHENDLNAHDRLLVADAVRLGMAHPKLSPAECLRIDKPGLSDDDCARLTPAFHARREFFRDANRRGPTWPGKELAP